MDNSSGTVKARASRRSSVSRERSCACSRAESPGSLLVILRRTTSHIIFRICGTPSSDISDSSVSVKDGIAKDDIRSRLKRADSGDD